MSLFSPKAIRDGKKLRKRLQNEAQKAYDKYKLTEEQLEAEKLKLLSKAAKEESSDQDEKALDHSRGLYFADLQTADATNGDESDSIFSASSVYFKNAFLNKLYHKLIFSEKMKLSWKQFMCFALMVQIPLGFINRHMHLINAWGAIVVLMVYVILGVVICIPVYMIYMFVGKYTRRSYIRYWDSVPLLKGLAYSIAMSSLYLEVFNVALAGIAAHYIVLMFSWHIPWVNCDFPDHSSDCVPLNIEESHYDNYTKECCNRFRDPNCTRSAWLVTGLKFSAFDYYVKGVLGFGHSVDTAEKNRYLIVLVGISWCIIFMLTVIGLRRFAKVMTGINLAIFASFVPISVFTFILSPNYAMVKTIKTDFTALRSYYFWVETGIHILHRELPADVLTFSAASKLGISTMVDTVIIYSMKLLFITIYTLWMSLAVSFLKNKYRVEDSDCITVKSINRDALLFAVFPDVITRLPLPQIWLILYFSIIYFWGLCTATYIYSSFLDALLEEFHVLNKWRIVVSAILCFVSGVGNALIMDDHIFDHYENLVGRTIVNQKGTILFLSLLGLFLYSIDRVKNDYHFYSGTILGTYWIVGLKMAMLLITLSGVALIANGLSGALDQNYWVFIIILSPTFLGIILAIMRYSLKISQTLISPSVGWGPPNRRQRIARFRFDPTHDLKYRSISHHCNHTCLLHSSALKKEMKYWLNRRQQLMQSQMGESEEVEILDTLFENNKK